MELKRLSCLVVAALLLLPLVGCAVEDGKAYDPDAYAAEFADGWQYQTLDEPLKRDYGALYTAVTDTCGEKDAYFVRDGVAVPGIKLLLPEPLPSGEAVAELLDAFTADHPRFFYLSNTYVYGGDRDRYTSLYVFYTMDTDARLSATAALDRMVDAIAENCPDADEYTREKHLHDALIRACDYDQPTADKLPTDHLSYTAYGALVQGKAVCEGYARALKLLCDRVGIAATTVSGKLPDGGTHTWNRVVVDGAPYHVDATWDDADGYVSHLYFNVTDGQIGRSRTDFAADPACTAADANYFRREGRYVDTFDRAAVAGIVAEAVRSGDEVIELSFASDKYAGGTLLCSNEALLVSMVQERLSSADRFTGYTLRGNPEEYALTITVGETDRM